MKIDINNETKISVQEYRAPTDDSIRLYTEMLKKARDEIIGNVRVKNTPVDIVVSHAEDCMNRDLIFVCVVEINGHRIISETKFDIFDAPKIGDVFRKVQADLANELSKHLLLTSNMLDDINSILR